MYSCHHRMREAVMEQDEKYIRSIAGMDYKIVDKEDESSLFLHLAAENGFTSICKVLVELGVGLEDRDSLGFTPLMHTGDHKETFFALLELGSDIHAKDNVGDTICGLTGNLEILTALKERGANFAMKDNGGNSLMHNAAGNYSYEHCKVLFDLGTSVGERNAKGRTPLHRVAASLYKKMFTEGAELINGEKTLEVLFSLGADDSVKDNDGKTPLDLAKKYNDRFANVSLIEANWNEIKERGKNLKSII